ncbi:hypothetical protein [Myroides odoratus]|uniref:hypothetical protein n=1 Tax=Myroides odoratus TaxID=256 RepID=UPI000765BF0C|nr:hypothetical protein [Myroides odoratus]
MNFFNKKTNTANPKSEDNKDLQTRLWIIFKFIFGIVILVTITYSILTDKLIIQIKDIDYTILLSFLLAFFSIILSMLFYFKSNDSSNKFYDNTYKFTKDISTILGRIEAGFGEKLQNLDKGYSVMLDKIDRRSISEKDVKAVEDNKKEIEKNIRETVDERNKLVQELIDKSTLDQKEKDSLKNSLQEKERTIFSLERELKLQREKLNQINLTKKISNSLKFKLKRLLSIFGYSYDTFDRATAEEFILTILNNDDINEHLKEELVTSNIIQNNNKITIHGFILLRNLLKNSEN